jgi:hypothetical protein
MEAVLPVEYVDFDHSVEETGTIPLLNEIAFLLIHFSQQVMYPKCLRKSICLGLGILKRCGFLLRSNCVFLDIKHRNFLMYFGRTLQQSYPHASQNTCQQ